MRASKTENRFSTTKNRFAKKTGISIPSLNIYQPDHLWIELLMSVYRMTLKSSLLVWLTIYQRDISDDDDDNSNFKRYVQFLLITVENDFIYLKLESHFETITNSKVLFSSLFPR